jgi:hypothetical protein
MSTSTEQMNVLSTVQKKETLKVKAIPFLYNFIFSSSFRPRDSGMAAWGLAKVCMGCVTS